MNTTADIAAPVAAALQQVLDTFDEELHSGQPFINSLLDQVRRYRGKLIRPTLLLLSGKATGDLGQPHITLAAVVEMVHLATLVHDDVLDDADVRRHALTVNRACGNEGAVLLGDYLISHAYHLCSSLGSTSASRRIAAVTNVVCEGELMQIERRGDFELPEEAYIEIVRRKTAALTSLCCELGADTSGADPRVVRQLAAFGCELGIAFQIVDDLLDMTATQDQVGKTVGRDADLGKLTLPLIRFRDTAPRPQRASLRDVLLSEGHGKTERIRLLLENSDAIAYAMEVAWSHVQRGVAQLADLPPGDAKDALATAAEFVVHRDA